MEQFKALGAALASTGAVALYHVVGFAPEAPTKEAVISGYMEPLIFDKATYDAVCRKFAVHGKIDFAVLGCPYVSIREMEEIAEQLRGQKLKSAMWVCTSRMERVLQGRCIVEGYAEGEVLYTDDAISFMGSVDPKTGRVIERNHALEGQYVSGKILVFPTSKGSTGGSYMLYDLVKNGVGPLGIINREAESVLGIGAIVSDLPTVDHVDIGQLHTGDYVRMDATAGTVTVLSK